MDLYIRVPLKGSRRVPSKGPRRVPFKGSIRVPFRVKGLSVTIIGIYEKSYIAKPAYLSPMPSLPSP